MSKTGMSTVLSTIYTMRSLPQRTAAINTANVEVIVTERYDGVIDMAHLIRLGMPNA